MADEPKVDTGNGEQQEGIPDYSGETLEQLEARFDAGEGMIVTRDDGPEVEVEAQPEPEPEPEAEPEVTVKADEPEAVAEEPDEVVEEEAEFDEKQSMIDELKLELERAEIERGKFEHLQSRDAGLAGHLRKEIQSLKDAVLRPQAETEVDPYAETPVVQQQAPSQPGDPALQSRLAELEASARAGAIEQEYEAFRVARGIDPEAAKELIQKMAPAIQASWKPYIDQVPDMSPSQVRKAIRYVLDGAYVDTGLTEIRQARTEAQNRVASQVPEKKKAKLAASVSGAGAAGAAPARAKPQSEFTAEEADAALIREFGDGHYVRGDR